MGYIYEKEKRELFTEDGFKTLLNVFRRAEELSNVSEVFTLEKMIDGCTGSSWTMLAAVDFLESIKEIKCVHSPGNTQKKIYIKL